jgi:hypothetical protein
MENNDSYNVSILNTVVGYTINFFNFMWAYSEYCIDNHMV